MTAPSAPLSPVAFLIAGTAAAVLVAVVVAAPLLVYSLALATFGAAHVASELRYVDCRFGWRLEPTRLAVIAALLAVAVSARAMGVAGWAEPRVALTVELLAAALLALAAIARPARRIALGLMLGCALAIATAAAPFDTAISLSILHNLTPLAFLYEITQGKERQRAMALGSVAFLGLPLLVATGIPRRLLESVGLLPSGLDPIGAGPLAEHLHVYVPSALLPTASAIDLFSASVVAQLAHFAGVIVVLPLLLEQRQGDRRGLVPWPRLPLFLGLVAAGSLVMLAGFAVSFAAARRLYGIAASLHAWIEIPLIVLALTQPASSNPTAEDAALAASDSASAWRGDSPAPHASTTASASTTSTSATPRPGR